MYCIYEHEYVCIYTDKYKYFLNRIVAMGRSQSRQAFSCDSFTLLCVYMTKWFYIHTYIYM